MCATLGLSDDDESTWQPDSVEVEVSLEFTEGGTTGKTTVPTLGITMEKGVMKDSKAACGEKRDDKVLSL